MKDFGTLINNWRGVLFRVRDAEKAHPRAKEYLHRLCRKGVVKRASWGWYYIP